MQPDSAAAAERLDAGVDQKDNHPDGNAEHHRKPEREAANGSLTASDQGAVETRTGFLGLEGDDGRFWIDDDIFVTPHVVDLDLVKVCEGVRLRDAGGVVGGAQIVDDVGVERAALELGQSFDKDALGICQDFQQRHARVSEVVDGEQLPARGRERSRAQDVPDMVVPASERRPDTQMRRGEGGEVLAASAFVCDVF